MQTIKIKYQVNSIDDQKIIDDCLRQYSSCLHFSYNRLIEGKNFKEIVSLFEHLNNVDLIDKWIFRSSLKEAELISSANKHAIFGGKRTFQARCKGSITNVEFKEKRINPLYCIGSKEQHGNRKFRIQTNCKTILFQLSKNIHITLVLSKSIKKNISKILHKLYEIQLNCNNPITFRLDKNYVYLMFDEKFVFGINKFQQIKNRIMAIDMNPNYIGWSIVDWKSECNYNIIQTGIFRLKPINDKENELIKNKIHSTDKCRKSIVNKRKFEVIEVAKNLISKSIYYNCSIFALENINISTNNIGRGKVLNRLCNFQWPHKGFVENLSKRCNINGIKFLPVISSYSSTIGNIIFRKHNRPDMINASIEIGRRAFEFNRQYIDNIESKQKNVVFPNMQKFADVIFKSLEEAKVTENFSDWVSLHSYLKNSKVMYRVPFNGNEKWFKFNSRKSIIDFC